MVAVDVIVDVIATLIVAALVNENDAVVVIDRRDDRGPVTFV